MTVNNLVSETNFVGSTWSVVSTKTAKEPELDGVKLLLIW
jgi:microcompartment protein CcmK/EutM